MDHLPNALKDLVGRAFWATFRVSPRPRSLGESMRFFADIEQVIAPRGQIVHYKQSVCPVTKERLEKLQVLVEDHDALPDRVDVIHNAEQLEMKLTPSETDLFAKFRDGRVQLRSLTRDYDRFKSVHS